MRGIASGRAWAVVSALLALLAAAVAWSLVSAPEHPVARAAASSGATAAAPAPTAAPTASGPGVADAQAGGTQSSVEAGHSQGAAVAEWALAAPPVGGSGLQTNPKSKPLELPTSGSAPTERYEAAPLQPLPVTGDAAAGSDQGTAAGVAQPTRPEVDALIRAFFPADQVENARRISMCESGQRNVTSRPNTDGTRDHGIFQINDGGTFQELARRLGSDPSNTALALDPEWNVRAAAELYRDRGWQPWTCSRKVRLV